VFWIIAKKEARIYKEQMMAQSEEQSMSGMLKVDEKPTPRAEDVVIL